MSQNKVIVITGGAGAIVDKATLEDFAGAVIQKWQLGVLVNNVSPGFRGIDECSYEQFQRSMAIGITAHVMCSEILLCTSPFVSSCDILISENKKGGNQYGKIHLLRETLKKEKGKIDQAKRQTWGERDPVAGKPTNSKAYNRKKSQAWKQKLPPTACDFFLTFRLFSLTIS